MFLKKFICSITFCISSLYIYSLVVIVDMFTAHIIYLYEIKQRNTGNYHLSRTGFEECKKACGWAENGGWLAVYLLIFYIISTSRFGMSVFYMGLLFCIFSPLLARRAELSLNTSHAGYYLLNYCLVRTWYIEFWGD